MSKVVISKNKRDKIESMLWALTSACFMTATMEGQITDGMIKMRDKQVKQIMDLLDNK
jgi:hypothetical protein